MPAPITVTTSGPISSGGLARQSILDIIQDACAVIGLAIPSAVYSSTDREHVELQRLANEMAQRIAFDTHDWTRLKSLSTMTGDGSAESFDMPEDYRRMLKKGNVWPSSSPDMPLQHVLDTDEWLGIDAYSTTWTFGAWAFIGEQMYIKPIMAVDATASFYYISTLIVYDAESNLKQRFTDDADTYRLDSRTLRLGIIWQWKANKGFPYAEDMTNYEEALSSQIAADKGSRILVSTRGPSGRFGVSTAYPWPLGS